MKKVVVLKSSAPMRVANSGFKIKQGQVLPHPGYPLSERTFSIFDDTEQGRKLAAKEAENNVIEKNIAIRHGVTNAKTLAKAMAKKAKEPSKEDRAKVAAKAKILTENGLQEPDTSMTDLQEENEKLKQEIEALKDQQATPNAYLDQNSRTVEKRVKEDIQKGKISQKNIGEMLSAEKKGQKRKSVLGFLKKLAEDDVVFGKLFKKK